MTTTKEEAEVALAEAQAVYRSACRALCMATTFDAAAEAITLRQAARMAIDVAHRRLALVRLHDMRTVPHARAYEVDELMAWASALRRYV